MPWRSLCAQILQTAGWSRSGLANKESAPPESAGIGSPSFGPISETTNAGYRFEIETPAAGPPSET